MSREYYKITIKYWTRDEGPRRPRDVEIELSSGDGMAWTDPQVGAALLTAIRDLPTLLAARAAELRMQQDALTRLRIVADRLALATPAPDTLLPEGDAS